MVLPFQYWPSITWMQHLAVAHKIELEQWGSYQKQSLTNRCKITGANGAVTLSVPLIGGREQKALLKDVQIDNSQPWAVQQLRTIKSCYGKAPFFDHYYPKVEALLLLPHRWLVELDYRIIQHLQMWLKMTTAITRTQQYQGIDVLTIPADTGPAPKSYIQVFAHKYSFVAGLSVLDVLFCAGPQAVTYFT